MSAQPVETSTKRKLIRRLRIAASVFFAAVTVLLCVFWVRSYWKGIVLKIQTNQSSFGIETAVGVLGVCFDRRGPYSRTFVRQSFEIDDGQIKHIEKLTTGGFGYVSDSSQHALIIPFWFLILCCLSLAWIIVGRLPNRNSYRFSLRTLLIATTIVAVVLGLGVWAAN